MSDEVRSASLIWWTVIHSLAVVASWLTGAVGIFALGDPWIGLTFWKWLTFVSVFLGLVAIGTAGFVIRLSIRAQASYALPLFAACGVMLAIPPLMIPILPLLPWPRVSPPRLGDYQQMMQVQRQSAELVKQLATGWSTT